MFAKIFTVFVVLTVAYDNEVKAMFKQFPRNHYNFGSPCPEIFEYRKDDRGDIYGSVMVNHPGQEGRIQLDVELSVGNSVEGYNGKIELAYDKPKVIDDIVNGRPVLYRVFFPVWRGIPPRVTKIFVNDNLVCSGSPIPIRLVPVLTTIRLQHKLRIDVTPLISTHDPTVDHSPHFNNLPGPDNFDIREYEVRSTNDGNFNNYLNKRENNDNPFLGITRNPYNFNPPARTDPAKVFPGNPFLAALTTPKPSSVDNSGSSGNLEGNVFFNARTSEAPQKIPVTPSPKVPQTIDVPQRGSGSGASNSLSTPYNGVCGRPISTNSLIVNGSRVPRGAYPWLVAIFVIKTTGLNYICSGSLVSNKHIVTAAHCIKTDAKKYKPQELLCILGKLNIQKWVPTNGEKMLEPESVIIHEDYETGSSDADIAIIVLPEPIEFTKFISPVCLWDGSNDLNEIVGKEGTVLGWGKDENGDISTAEPRQINLPIVTQEQCLRSGIQFQFITSNRTFCAGSRNGSGPCNGDSGSGFIIRRNGKFMLRGIVSIAVSEPTQRTCDLKNYVVFTDASKFSNWLSNHLK